MLNSIQFGWNNITGGVAVLNFTAWTSGTLANIGMSYNRITSWQVPSLPFNASWSLTTKDAWYRQFVPFHPWWGTTQARSVVNYWDFTHNRITGYVPSYVITPLLYLIRVHTYMHVSYIMWLFCIDRFIGTGDRIKLPYNPMGCNYTVRAAGGTTLCSPFRTFAVSPSIIGTLDLSQFAVTVYGWVYNTLNMPWFSQHYHTCTCCTCDSSTNNCWLLGCLVGWLIEYMGNQWWCWWFTMSLAYSYAIS